MPALAAYAMTASFEQHYDSHGYSEDSSVDGGSGHPVQPSGPLDLPRCRALYRNSPHPKLSPLITPRGRPTFDGEAPFAHLGFVRSVLPTSGIRPI